MGDLFSMELFEEVPDLLSGLNPPQAEAVQHTEGPMLILAGAGSGKTRVLTHRAAHIISTGLAAPSQILCVTFTNKAAREMQERIHNLLGPQGQGVWVRTFHSLGLAFIRSGMVEIPVDREAVVYDDADQRTLMREVLKRLNIDPERNTPRAVLGKIEQFKRRGLLPDDLGDQQDVASSLLPIVDIYREYQDALEQNKALDFGDLLLWPVWALRNQPSALETIQNRFRYLMVDEYQDTNPIQYELVKLLAKRHKNLAVVGDDDQSIYGWRGADVSNILGFERDFDDAKVVRLEQNYRSTANILDAAWEVVRKNHNRKEKKLWTEKPAGDPLYIATLVDDRAEAKWIAERIQEEQRKGASYANIAVFYRANSQSRVLEEVLRLSSIPYRIVGATAFYDRKEVRDVLAYLRMIHNPNDWVSFQRVANVPRRGIGKTTIERVLAVAAERPGTIPDVIRMACGSEVGGAPAKKLSAFGDFLQSQIDAARDLGVAELTRTVLAEIDYKESLQAEGIEVARDRWENVEALLSAMHDFEDVAKDPSVGAYLDEVALVQGLTEEREDVPKVSLMTLHSAKGLEFGTVFMAGMEEGFLPHARSQDDEGIEEERRLCYVGITRAQNRLYLTRARTHRIFGEQSMNLKSRFLEEIPETYLKDISPGASSGMFPHPPPPRRRGARPAASSASSSSAKKATGQSVPDAYTPGKRLIHPKFGTGVVREVDHGTHGYKLKIEFMDGVKTILPAYVELKPAS